MPRRSYPLYTWDRRLRRYRDKRNGRLVPVTEVRRALDAALDAETRRARELGDAMRRGQVTVRAFERGMREIIKNTQLFSAAAAKGGWAQMTASDRGFVGARVRQQYAFLTNFVAEVRAGLPRDGRFLQRVGMYPQAARQTYHEVEAGERLAAGKTLVRNVLHPADHCKGPGSCLEQSRLGWQPIGLISLPGQRLCRANCRCTLQYKAAA